MHVGLARRWPAAAGLLLCALLSARASDADVAELESRLEEQSRLVERLSQRLRDLELREEDREAEVELLEEQLFDVTDRVGTRSVVQAFDGVSLDIGGFLTQTLTLAHGDDATEVSPNQTLFELLVAADVTERISFFTALGFLREADLDFSERDRPRFRDSANRVPLIIGWGNYRHSDELQLRFGRFVTPHGIINIEHFPPMLLEINQPQFLRPFPGATLFPDFLNGFELHGSVPVGESGSDLLRWSAYYGMFNPSPDRPVTGARLAWDLTDVGVALGLNYSYGDREAGAGPPGHLTVVPAVSTVENRYHLLGADFRVDHGRLLWKNEVFYTLEAGQDDRLGFYTQPAWRFSDRWTGFYRFDLLDPGQDTGSVIEHVLGANYLPFPIVRLRGALFYKDFLGAGEDAWIGQLSATVSF